MKLYRLQVISITVMTQPYLIKNCRVQDPDRNLRIFEKLIAQGNVLDARQQFYYARELYYHNQFEKAIQVFNAFLQREDAWVENQIDACTFIFYCRRQMGQKQEAALCVISKLCL